MDDLKSELSELKGFIAELKADRAATKEKEKRESWTRYVSLTVVLIAVLGTIAAQWSGKYGSRVQLNQALASDQWNYYQASSIKGHMVDVTGKLFSKIANPADPDYQKILKSYESDGAKYNDRKTETEKYARALEDYRDANGRLGSRMGPVIQLLSVSIALASMCLLTRKKPLWLLAILMAGIASAMMVSIRMNESTLVAPASPPAATPAKSAG